MKETLVAVGIPAYKAQGTIFKTLASIAIQSISDKIKVYIAKDCPYDVYDEIVDCFRDMEI